MDDLDFDKALVASAFALADEIGWARVTVAAAAQRGDLPLDRARRRFPIKLAVLLRFGSLADQAALAGLTNEGTGRDRMFDLIMRRIDMLQAHRAGVLALLRTLPMEPLTALVLSRATLDSMNWLLDAIGVPSDGPVRAVRAKGLLAVWLYTVRAWRRDMSEDLSATMAALDTALSRAEQADRWLGDRPGASETRREDPSFAAETPSDDPSGFEPPPIEPTEY